MSKQASKASNARKNPKNQNLKFLDLFLKKMKWSKPEFAQMIGYTKAAVYHWFKVDNMFLTTLHEVFQKIGYEVVFTMEMPDVDKNINIEIAPEDKNEVHQEKRLSFLHDALYDNDIDQHKLAKYLGIDVETIDYWFRHDKCKIGYIFQTAKFTGMTLKVDIRPIAKEDL